MYGLMVSLTAPCIATSTARVSRATRVSSTDSKPASSVEAANLLARAGGLSVVAWLCSRLAASALAERNVYLLSTEATTRPRTRDLVACEVPVRQQVGVGAARGEEGLDVGPVQRAQGVPQPRGQHPPASNTFTIVWKLY